MQIPRKIKKSHGIHLTPGWDSQTPRSQASYITRNPAVRGQDEPSIPSPFSHLCTPSQTSQGRRSRGERGAKVPRGVCVALDFLICCHPTQNEQQPVSTPPPPFLARNLHFQLGNAVRDKEEGPSPPRSIVDC
ncbi:hypothetical protein CSHISOI_01745 [Colletotrichum shisoi]|uniref:Uncharacterized protein n=1 Tax=Colletotrichum shisoi TaxID=2078593 RepID=A0A5Q4C2Z2_9PEZI|nr:hypothetical protein CSHISOI_01745 [Colletotrichum shisoi]